MSGDTDRLARIEERAQPPRLRLTLSCGEVLALVEIAKAARFAVHSIDPNSTLARRTLEDALSALDGDT